MRSLIVEGESRLIGPTFTEIENIRVISINVKDVIKASRLTLCRDLHRFKTRDEFFTLARCSLKSSYHVKFRHEISSK
jgi:hypothetical protein